jgi:hypothetical protein
MLEQKEKHVSHRVIYPRQGAALVRLRCDLALTHFPVMPLQSHMRHKIGDEVGRDRLGW